MKTIIRFIIVSTFSMLMLISCQEKTKDTLAAGEDNSELQLKLLNYTKEFNAQAKKDSSAVDRLKQLKLEYNHRVDSIKTCSNWKGKITLLDLDEIDAYSKDTVMMRIGIENIYDSGDQDYFSFVEVKPIPKKGELYEKLNTIKKGAKVAFSGKIIGVSFQNSIPGYEFNNFFIEMKFSDIEAIK